MATINVKCPSCQEIKVVKNGFSFEKKQRYLCNNSDCKTRTFILEYTNKGYLKEIKESIINLTLNGSGIRDSARVLCISTNTVLSELKKKNLNCHQ